MGVNKASLRAVFLALKTAPGPVFSALPSRPRPQTCDVAVSTSPPPL